MRMGKTESADAVSQEELAVLLEKIRTGTDMTAFEMLCRLYANLLDAAVRQFAPSMGITAGRSSDLLGIGMEELRQDAAMALYKAACSYSPGEAGKGQDVSFGLYAKICIRNAMITQVRRYNRKKKRLAEQKQKVQKEADTAETPVLAEETMDRILRVLSSYEKKILPLYMSGKPPREIAVILGRTEKSVSNGIYRIKCKIRQVLDES